MDILAALFIVLLCCSPLIFYGIASIRRDSTDKFAGQWTPPCPPARSPSAGVRVTLKEPHLHWHKGTRLVVVESTPVFLLVQDELGKRALLAVTHIEMETHQP